MNPKQFTEADVMKQVLSSAEKPNLHQSPKPLPKPCPKPRQKVRQLTKADPTQTFPSLGKQLHGGAGYCYVVLYLHHHNYLFAAFCLYVLVGIHGYTVSLCHTHFQKRGCGYHGYCLNFSFAI